MKGSPWDPSPLDLRCHKSKISQFAKLLIPFKMYILWCLGSTFWWNFKGTLWSLHVIYIMYDIFGCDVISLSETGPSIVASKTVRRMTCAPTMTMIWLLKLCSSRYLHILLFILVFFFILLGYVSIYSKGKWLIAWARYLCHHQIC